MGYREELLAWGFSSIFFVCPFSGLGAGLGGDDDERVRATSSLTTDGTGQSHSGSIRNGVSQFKVAHVRLTAGSFRLSAGGHMICLPEPSRSSSNT